jgi:hypothetical protein
MTYARISLAGLLPLLALAAACGGPVAKNDGGAIDSSSADRAVDADAPAADTSPGTDGGADSGPPVGRDCFPECAAAVRRSCQRPLFGAGSCTQGMNGPDTVYCYSNGVREIRQPVVDGGTTADFTQPDGQTPCYQVVVSGADQSIRSASGQEVARVTFLGGGLFDVTCGGATVTVDINDPACRTLNSADCVPGTCS